MFARVKKTGPYEYLQIVENRREDKKSRQRVIATVGRMDELRAKGQIETLTRSLSRFSEKALLVLSDRNDSLRAEAKKIGPALIFERLWKEVGMDGILHRLLTGRKFGFAVERAIFLTVLHRLFPSGSDRSCDRWHREYVINGMEGLSLHHLYRAMAFLGEEIEDEKDHTVVHHRLLFTVIGQEGRKPGADALGCILHMTYHMGQLVVIHRACEAHNPDRPDRKTAGINRSTNGPQPLQVFLEIDGIPALSHLFNLSKV